MFSTPPPQQRIVLDLLRHGEPIGGVRYRGAIDDALSDTGWQQMQTATLAALEHSTRWDSIISSPLKRCHVFADFLATQQHIPLAIIHDFKELSFGDFEGQTPQQVWQQHPQLLSDIWRDPESYTPPNGEPYPDFKHRVNTGLQHILTQYQDQHLLLVIHGGVIRALLTLLLNIAPKDTFRIEIPYAGLSRITVYLPPESAKNSESVVQASLNFLNRFSGGE